MSFNPFTAYTDSPNRVCTICGNKFIISESFKNKLGYPTWVPQFCSKCWIKNDEKCEILNRRTKRKDNDLTEEKIDNIIEKRKQHISELLNAVDVPYPYSTEIFNLEEKLIKVTKLLMANEWVIFQGVAGSGKTYLASLVMRRIACHRELWNKTFSYITISQLVSEIKMRWQSEKFDTGEDLVDYYKKIDILCIEINDTEVFSTATNFKNDLLFKIFDIRYIDNKKGIFKPTLIIAITYKNKGFLDTFLGAYDKAVIGRIRELGARNVFLFPKTDIREMKAKSDVNINKIPEPNKIEPKFGKK